MKKTYWGFLLLAFSLLILAPSVRAKADDGYDINGYQVDIKVTRQNTYHITETILADFYESKHGIYRDIPIVNEIERSDGSKGKITAKIKNISCSDECEISTEDGNRRLKIGDPDKTITGEKTYTISYDYVLGNDILEGNDEFYFNVIGTQWTTSISNVSFSIEMPDSFEEKNLGMTYGSYGTENPDGLYYRIDGNTIYGELDSSVTLSPGEGVTVRLLLPEGYFEKSSDVPWNLYLTIAIGIVAIVTAFVLWWIFGRDDVVVDTVEFHAPDGMNSLELAFAYRGNAESTDVVSLIVYLAQKGYIDIVEGENKKDFTLVKKKPYDGDNSVEQMFMDGLFLSGDMVKKKNLENKFYKTIEAICHKVNAKENKTKLFYANSINKGWILWLMSFVLFFSAGFMPVYDYTGSFTTALFSSLGCGLLFLLAALALVQPGKLLGRIFIFLCMGVVAIAVFALFLEEELKCAGTPYLWVYLFAVLAGGVVMFFNTYMSKRTEYGTMILGRIRGFKNFLEMAEKDRLEALVEQNPQYFYEILPYTYVLGISDMWMKKFESITIEPPDWYCGHQTSMFDVVMFNHFMNDTMSAATSSMTSSPSSSSGGGISGGGSGGGGGGSW